MIKNFNSFLTESSLEKLYKKISTMEYRQYKSKTHCGFSDIEIKKIYKFIEFQKDLDFTKDINWGSNNCDAIRIFDSTGNKEFHVFKMEDEWFLIKIIEYSRSGNQSPSWDSVTYLCDTMEGVIQFTQDLINCDFDLDVFEDTTFC